MKELSIEEKAKAYDEAIKKLRSLHDNYDTVSTLIDVKEELENIFPELAESEDERIIERILFSLQKDIMATKNSGCSTKDLEKCIAWLEKQGEQKRQYISRPKYIGEEELLGEQKPTEWSEEDETNLNDAIDACKAKYGNMSYTADWLKSLKYRVQPQPKQEWSKEDEDILNTIINHFKIDIECTDEDDVIRWLKSLRPQNHWKPSEEQMITLEHYMHTLVCNHYKEILFSLYQDLKKLKG